MGITIAGPRECVLVSPYKCRCGFPTRDRGVLTCVFQGLICTQKHMYTIGTSETVLIREVSLFQRLISTQKYTIGTSETVLIREVSLFQRLICTQKYTIGTSETVLIREMYFIVCKSMLLGLS